MLRLYIHLDSLINILFFSLSLLLSIELHPIIILYPISFFAITKFVLIKKNPISLVFTVLLKVIFIFQVLRFLILDHDTSTFTFKATAYYIPHITLNGLTFSFIIFTLFVFIWTFISNSKNIRVAQKMDFQFVSNDSFMITGLLIVKLLIVIYFGIGRLGQVTIGLSFLDRLLPNQILWVFTSLILLRTNSSFKYLNVIILILIGLFQNSKAFIFEGIIIYFIVFGLFYRRNVSFSINKIVLIVFILVSAIVGFVTMYAYRRGDVSLLTMDNVELISGVFLGRLSFIDSFTVLSENVYNHDFDNVISLKSISLSVLSALLPGVHFNDIPSIGQAVGTVFQNVPENYPHAGALGFIPLFFGKFSYAFSTIILLLIVFGIQKKLVRMNMKNYFILLPLTMFMLVQLFLSGNLDRIITLILTNYIVGASLIYTINRKWFY